MIILLHPDTAAWKTKEGADICENTASQPNLLLHKCTQPLYFFQIFYKSCHQEKLTGDLFHENQNFKLKFCILPNL